MRKLVLAMYRARTNSPGLGWMGKQDEAPDPAMFRGAGVSNMLAEMDALRQQYANFCLSLCVGGFYDPAFCHFRMNRKRGV